MPEQFTNGYALLVGVNENYEGGWALPYVAKDIQALRDVLTHPERCAYPESNVQTITGQEATRQGILDGLEWLQKRVVADTSGNTTAIVYYTGHGWRRFAKPELYLIPYDIREGQIPSRALRSTDFAEAIGVLKSRRLLVVLDCCHAGGMGVKGLLPTGYAGLALAPTLLMAGEEIAVGPGTKGTKGLKELTQGQGRAVLSSSTGEQPSYRRLDKKMSIFTYHLIEALTGHAQPQEGATEVLVSDVMSHVWRRVPESAKADWGVEQTPDYQVSGNFPIALLLGGKGISKGQPAPDPLVSLPGQAMPHTVIDIDTGGGPFFGGPISVTDGDFVAGDQSTVVITGDGNVVGDYSSSTVVKQATEGATVQDFVALLAKLRWALSASGLEADEIAVIEADVRTVEEQAQKEQPNKAIILSKLKGIIEILAAGGKIATAAVPLATLVQKAIGCTQELFR